MYNLVVSLFLFFSVAGWVIDRQFLPHINFMSLGVVDFELCPALKFNMLSKSILGVVCILITSQGCVICTYRSFCCVES